MGTYNASAYNNNHTLLKLILNIQDYLHKNPNVALYHTVGFQGTVATTSIPKDKVYGPAGSTTTPTAGDVILYALDLGQGFFQVGGADEDNYTGEYIGQTLTGPKGDPGPEGPEGPEGPAGTPGVKLYYTTGFQGTVATTSIPKDKVHGPTGSTTTPIIGDVILYALEIGQGYFMVSGADASNYIGSYIGQTIQGEKGDKGDPGTPGAAATIAVGTVTTGDPTTPAAVTNAGTSSAAVFNFTIPRGEKGDKGDPGTGYSQITGLYFNRQNDSVTYSDGIAVFVGQFQLTTADGNSTFANGAVTLPIVAGAGIIIDASEDGRSLIIKAAPIEYIISGGYGHCENNNPAAVADEGTAYVATITANSGYNFGTGYTLTVTMGGTDITSEVAIVSTDTISINIPSVTGDIYINCVAVEIPPQLATPTIAMNADGKTLEITDVANATSYDVYIDGTLKTNVASAPNTTTVDLSTLSDITDGTHTVKVKAKADGYRDSEFSNEVSYTKAPVSYAITFGTVTGSNTPKMNGSYYNIKFADGSYLQLSSSSTVSVEYYDANGNRIGETAFNGQNMATRFGVGGVNSTTVEYYGRINSYYDSVDYGYFTVGNSEHLSPTVSSSNPHTTKTVSGELNIYGKYPD